MQATAERTYCAILSRDPCNTRMLLRISKGRISGVYDVRCEKLLHPHDGGVCFHFEKPNGEVHHVKVDEDDSKECDCRGFLRHGHCKHVETLELLAQQEVQRQEDSIEEKILAPSGYAIPRVHLRGKDYCPVCDGWRYNVEDNRGQRCLVRCLVCNGKGEL